MGKTIIDLEPAFDLVPVGAEKEQRENTGGWHDL